MVSKIPNKPLAVHAVPRPLDLHSPSVRRKRVRHRARRIIRQALRGPLVVVVVDVSGGGAEQMA